MYFRGLSPPKLNQWTLDSCIETPDEGYGSILVITNHFTPYKTIKLQFQLKIQLLVQRLNQFYLKYNFIVQYGIPLRLHTDQGRIFESNIIDHLTGMNKSHTTPYHPVGNGSCERFNRTLLGMLIYLDGEQKKGLL